MKNGQKIGQGPVRLHLLTPGQHLPPYKQLVRCVRSFLRDLSPLSPRNHKENKMLPLEGILRQATGQEAFQ